MTLRTIFEKEQKEFLVFLKNRSMLYHLSNVFFRDFHYGVMSYLEMKNIRYGYTEAEALTRWLVETLENQGILRAIDRQTFTLLYPEFKKPPVKPAAPKPAAPSPAAAKAAPSAKPVESTSPAATSSAGT